MADTDSIPEEYLWGRIYSVYCKHFISYNEVLYHPQLYLNVITGPNGTGKSTIVAAIVLGLGGEATLLNKAAKLPEYVKSGAETATIVIQIYSKENKKRSFQRKINTRGKSYFSIDSKEVTRAKFLEEVAAFNIQVGNLCQFLPQDRVQDFSKMNPQELLYNTMISVSDSDLVDPFNNLKQLRKEQVTLKADLEKDNQNLDKIQQRIEQLQVSVAQFKEREEIIKKLNVYTSNKKWIELKNGKVALEELEAKSLGAKKDMRVLLQKHEVEKKILQEIAEELSKCQLVVKQHDQLVLRSNSLNEEMSSQMELLIRRLKDERAQHEQRVERSSKSEREMEHQMQLLQTLRNDVAENQKDVKNLQTKLDEVKLDLKRMRNDTLRRYSQKRQNGNRIMEIKMPEITALRFQMEKIRNTKQNKIAEVRRKNRNLDAGMRWVEANRDKFQGKIYDPLIFELDIVNPNAVKYLENMIRNRDLYAFPCENKEDMSALITELCVKQKLHLNVICCPLNDGRLYEAPVPMEQMKKYGFYGYMLDQVRAPRAILRKLCATYNLHSVPIGFEDVTNHTAQIPKSIRCYFAGNKRFTITISKYRSDHMLIENHVLPKNNLIFVDTKKMADLQKQIDEAQAEVDRARNSLNGLENEFAGLQEQIRNQDSARDKLEMRLNHFRSLENTLESKEAQVKQLAAARVSKETLEANFKRFAEKSECEFGELMDKMQINQAAWLEAEKDRMSVFELECMQRAKHEPQLELVNEIEGFLRTSEGVVEQINHSIAKQKRFLDSKKEQIRLLCDGKLPDEDGFAYEEDFEKIKSWDLEQTNETIHELEARLDCMQQVDSEAISDFKRRETDLENLKSLIESKGQQRKSIETAIQELYSMWYPKLLGLVEKISGKYGEFMDSLTYLGEVVLTKKEDFDFESYGIQIMVQYRKNVRLQALDKFVQSGGERAVAIAIYSLSLQHVTNVPFRCVDEINQGMDAHNERKIFNLLLNEATKPGSAQYIFVTPKLLKDLNYNNKLCVAVVMNSATCPSDLKIPHTLPIN